VILITYIIYISKTFSVIKNEIKKDIKNEINNIKKDIENKCDKLFNSRFQYINETVSEITNFKNDIKNEMEIGKNNCEGLIKMKDDEHKAELTNIKKDIENKCDKLFNSGFYCINETVTDIKTEMEIIRVNCEGLIKMKDAERKTDFKNEMEIVKKDIANKCDKETCFKCINVLGCDFKNEMEIVKKDIENNCNKLFNSRFQYINETVTKNIKKDVENNMFESCISLFTQTDFIKIECIDKLQYINNYKPRGVYFTKQFFNIMVLPNLFKKYPSKLAFPSVESIYLSSPYIGNNDIRNEFFKLFPNVLNIFIRGDNNNSGHYFIKISELYSYFVDNDIGRYFHIDNETRPLVDSIVTRTIQPENHSYQLSLQFHRIIITYDMFINIEKSTVIKYDNKGNEQHRMYSDHIIASMIPSFRFPNDDKSWKALYLN